jgi:hypothetical protein
MLLAQWNVSLIFVQIKGSNELLDLIDSQRLIDSSSCTSILTTSVTYSATDHREWVVKLDELKSIFISALSSHLDISLN